MIALKRMKRINIILITILIFTLMITNKTQAKTNDSKIYHRCMKVIDLNYFTNIVTVEDANGFIFQFVGCEDYFINDLVICTMNNNNTKEIFDDEIIDTVFSGFALDKKV